MNQRSSHSATAASARCTWLGLGLGLVRVRVTVTVRLRFRPNPNPNPNHTVALPGASARSRSTLCRVSLLPPRPGCTSATRPGVKPASPDRWVRKRARLLVSHTRSSDARCAATSCVGGHDVLLSETRTSLRRTREFVACQVSARVCWNTDLCVPAQDGRGDETAVVGQRPSCWVGTRSVL